MSLDFVQRVKVMFSLDVCITNGSALSARELREIALKTVDRMSVGELGYNVSVGAVYAPVVEPAIERRGSVLVDALDF
jgi:hypothetical protein